MNRYTLFVLSFWLLNLVSARGQNVEFKSSLFKDKKEAFKIAESQLESGETYFKEALKLMETNKDASSLFLQAKEPFLKANEFNPDNANLNYKLGVCFFYTYNVLSSIPYFEKALKLKAEDCDPDVYFLLGKAYKLDYRFDQAKAQFSLYITIEKDRVLQKINEELQREISQCDIAKSMVAKPLERLWVEAVKDWNSEYNEYNPSITADESTLIFNTDRPATKEVQGKNTVWIANREKSKWSQPQPFGVPFETAGQYEGLAVSYDGQTLYLGSLGDQKDIYVSKLDGKTWTTPLRLPDKINSAGNETGACFSTDGIKMYYVTDQGVGIKGGKDLFFSGVMDRMKNIWGEGMTIGSEVNTVLDENSIYMHPDGKTIYFASKGHQSMGGYDIFKSTRLAGRWSAPENLGYPINTPADETSFVMSASGKRAYITSNRKEGGKGGFDIYRITWLGPVKQPINDFEDQLLADVASPQRDARMEGSVAVETKNLTILKGRILDDFTGQPVKADIEITDNVKNEVIATFSSNSVTGKFLVSLPAGFNYGIAVKAKDYLFHSENFNLPEKSEYQLVEKEIRLKGACLGCKIILKNIFFDTGKFVIRPESTPELNRLASLINDLARVKPGIKIEISGHTDNVGSETSNQVLSENRAKAVVKFLVDQGISQSKLVFKGYGSLQPISTNATPEGKQENRRTEFKIIGE